MSRSRRTSRLGVCRGYCYADMRSKVNARGYCRQCAAKLLKLKVRAL